VLRFDISVSNVATNTVLSFNGKFGSLANGFVSDFQHLVSCFSCGRLDLI
jgi:hypothetical protein